MKVIVVRAATLASVPAGPAVSEVENPRPEAGELLVRVASSFAGLLRPGGRFASTLGATPDNVTAFSVMADPTPQTLTQLAADAASGVLRVPVTATCPLAQVHEAVAASARARSARSPSPAPDPLKGISA